MLKKALALLCISPLIIAFIFSSSSNQIITFGDEVSTSVSGKLYEFGENSEYNFSSKEEYSKTDKSNTYGEFLLNGNLKESTVIDGISAYEVDDNGLSITYKYHDLLLNAHVDSWHLYSDDVKKINGKDMGEKIKKGAILIQTSMDRINWTNVLKKTNVFSSIPNNTDSFYTAKDIELINGCYYRVIIAYAMRVRTKDSNILFVNTDKYDCRKYAEVYEFYAFKDTKNNDNIDYSQTYNLGSKVRTKEFNGYSGKTTIDKKDIHYGWDLGNFFVSGYTDKRINDDSSVVFLKNVDDKVTLWFNLAQDINALNGNSDLTITGDSEGYDQYFETPKTNFGKGALIIRYTDYNNNKSEPQIYTNYLKANTSIGADTKVQLFEEGDYEVALDYEVTEDRLINEEAHYRIFFKFSVRNGNCMVYPFDIASGSELNNSAMTENGFRLDLAKSRYLNVNIKREVLKDSADGLIEDTRFNGPAKDGAEYTEEGIYTITVSNNYTNQFTVKKIYVGTNKVLRAYMTTGLSIPEINNLIADGATILNDGTIQLAEPIIETEAPITTTQSEETTIATTTIKTTTPPTINTNNQKVASPIIIFIIIGIISAGSAIMVIILKNKKTNTSSDNSEGGAEE